MNKPVLIIIDEMKDYYECPRCKEANITRGFNVCIDCNVRIEWKRKK